MLLASTPKTFLAGFNPQQLRRATATPSQIACHMLLNCFNPQQLRRATATWCLLHRVSCPFLCFNPQQLRRATATPLDISPSCHFLQSFNPQQLRRATATMHAYNERSSMKRFQSSAAPKSHCYFKSLCLSHPSRSFQSSAAPKSHCYSFGYTVYNVFVEVSILSSSEEPLLLLR